MVKRSVCPRIRKTVDLNVDIILLTLALASQCPLTDSILLVGKALTMSFQL
jgi:hypothetical protein